MRRLSSLGLGALLWLTSALAADRLDQAAFDSASRDLEIGLWDRAEREFSDFLVRFPKSPLLGDAESLRAFAAAEAAFARNDWAAAAAGFAEYQKAHPGGARGALAAVREAESRQRAGAPAAAAAVLRAAGGGFAAALASGQPAGVLLRGLLVEAACLSATGDAGGAEAALAQATPLARTPAEQADRWRGLALAREASSSWAAAAEAAANWADIALKDVSAAGGSHEAAAVAARCFLRAGDTARARDFFQRNRSTNTPPALQRDAAMGLAELSLSSGDPAGARAAVEGYIASAPQDPEIGPLRALLGRALFDQFVAARANRNAAGAAALAAEAGREFRRALSSTNLPPEFAGPAALGLGWCLWEAGFPSGGPEWVEATAQFAAAARTLPTGPAQSTAQFKLADCLLAQGSAAAAWSNYWAVAEGNPGGPDAAAIKEQALWQAVVAGVQAGDPSASDRAMRRLLETNPRGEPAARSALLVGQSLAKNGDVEAARDLLSGYLARFPDSPLRADCELSLAAIELRAQRWDGAILKLDAWLTANTNHPARPRAEFDRAWASAKAGLATNAVEEFAALAARFPGHPLAETAQLWLAGHFFSIRDYARAEQACLPIATNAAWRGDPAWLQARLLAAEAARRRESWSSAREQLLELLNDKAAQDAWPTAYFSLGELLLERPPETGASPLARYKDALEAFSAAANFTNAPVRPAALGKMGDCEFQLSAGDPARLPQALGWYQKALDSPQADTATRCQAAAGRGYVFAKMADAASGAAAAALRNHALDAWMDILDGKVLRPGQRADPFWMKEAGREGGQLLEISGRWRAAATLYDRLARELPSFAPAWRARAEKARRQDPG